MLEEKTYRLLIDRKIIKGKGMLVDATVFPENIKYPNDVGLLNDVREWLVETSKPLGKKVIHKPRQQMLQYVRRNLKQLDEIIKTLKDSGVEIGQKVLEKLEVGRIVKSSP